MNRCGAGPASRRVWLRECGAMVQCALRSRSQWQGGATKSGSVLRAFAPPRVGGTMFHVKRTGAPESGRSYRTERRWAGGWTSDAWPHACAYGCAAPRCAAACGVSPSDAGRAPVMSPATRSGDRVRDQSNPPARGGRRPPMKVRHVSRETDPASREREVLTARKVRPAVRGRGLCGSLAPWCVLRGSLVSVEPRCPTVGMASGRHR